MEQFRVIYAYLRDGEEYGGVRVVRAADENAAFDQICYLEGTDNLTVYVCNRLVDMVVVEKEEVACD